MADEKSVREHITEGLNQAGGSAPKKTNSAAAGIPAGGGEKIVRDAAGNVIGKADRAQVVRDKWGKVIGEVGPPEPEPDESVKERISRGFEENALKVEEEMAGIIETMTGHAKTIRALRDKTSQWDFKRQREAKVKEGELKAKFEADKERLLKLRLKVQGRPFLKEADNFISNLERHLKDEEPFNPHRF